LIDNLKYISEEKIFMDKRFSEPEGISNYAV